MQDGMEEFFAKGPTNTRVFMLFFFGFYYRFGTKPFVQVRNVENKVARKYDSVSVYALCKTSFILIYVYIVKEEREDVSGEGDSRKFRGL